MSENNSETDENKLLEVYEEAVDNYEFLVHLLTSEQNNLNIFAVLENLTKCSSIIETVINLEMDNNFLLRKQLMEQIYIIQSKINKNQTVILTAEDIILTTNKNNFLPEHLKQLLKSQQNSEPKDKDESIIANIKVQPAVNNLEEVIGLQSIKNTLKTIVILPLHQPQLFHNLNTNNSILLFGPPGTGKTRIVHALAAEAGADLYVVNSSDIFSEYVGRSEKTVRAIFENVQQSKQLSFLFIDEIDGFCRKRTANEGEYCRRLKTELMCQLNNMEKYKNVFLICATNCPWDLDSAFIRRFGKRIYVPLPERNERFNLLQFYLKNVSLGNTFNNWSHILDKTEGYSSSDIANLIKTALIIPITELQSTTMWRLSQEEFYEPAYSLDENCIKCTLNDLPVNSVKARNIEMSDLIATAESMKKTVSEMHIQQYEDYINN